MTDSRRVLVLVAAVTHYGREAMLGMFRYANTRTQWDMHYEGRCTPRDLRMGLRRWRAEAIFAQIHSRQMWRMIVRAGIPAVNISGLFCEELANVCPDNEVVGRIAAEHLMQRGLRAFAYCGLGADTHSDDRERGFTQVLKEAGFGVQCFRLHTSAHGWDWYRDHIQITDWLRALPKPVGLMACNDYIARYLLWACRPAGLRVPDEIALVGVDNDTVEGALCNVPLSSVDIPARLIGERAAELLDRLLLGSATPRTTIKVPPLGVVTRQSTDVYASADPAMVAVLRHLGAVFAGPVAIPDVASHFGVSRRSLEMRFRSAFGRSPGAELTRVRLEHAKRLLTTTDLKITAVYGSCGFNRHSYFSQLFRRKIGLSPEAYRRQFRVHEVAVEPIPRSRHRGTRMRLPAGVQT